MNDRLYKLIAANCPTSDEPASSTTIATRMRARGIGGVGLTGHHVKEAWKHGYIERVPGAKPPLYHQKTVEPGERITLTLSIPRALADILPEAWIMRGDGEQTDDFTAPVLMAKATEVVDAMGDNCKFSRDVAIPMMANNILDDVIEACFEHVAKAAIGETNHMSQRERDLVNIVEWCLANLGSENGYFTTCGAIQTRKLIAALAAYGITPRYGNHGRSLGPIIADPSTAREEA